MKFYDRKNELTQLKEVECNSHNSGKMTFIVGRRRVGKTALIREAYKKNKFIYFFVSKKNESLLCEEFISEFETETQIKVFGIITTFKELFAYLLDVSKNYPFTLAIDEFQGFERINNSIYSDMQNLWDRNKNTSKLNLVLCGSIYSMMKRIFENNKEPLFGRADKKINLKPFRVDTLKQILKDHYQNYTAEDLLTFYIITGGVAKYVELFINDKICKHNSIINYIFSPNSIFLEEGKNILIEEFGKEYGTYFSILSLISNSKTSRSEIESILEKNIGGYLDKLENEYSVIKKIKPILAKSTSRTQKYFINDNFLNFWFRYIYKFRSAIEIENFDLMRKVVKKDFRTYSGRFLEKYFVEKLVLSNDYSEIGTYWERKNLNEIDIVAVNDLYKKALIAEVKLNPDKISINNLKFKSKNLVSKLKGYDIEYKGFSLEDM